jgi:chromosome segregation protein
MLKALELLGFKSFADKTRFEFPPGITVVVGPNGSGKSNVVDAIKWVLGEQSVKSLRGKEMADVIFNGSGNRRPMNAAEITLTFDNQSGRLAIDTPEVHITRRIYRSGEGEYLINRQPSRLRDIRDLLTGTGLSTQAYSVIEQGKVDVLLQSSARDRRVIFEEAAGISRFKARKIESLRRLERVEQNLLRLSDIVDEVDSRLRSVKLQAGKARRYKEYTDRLQELRTQTASVDWRRLTERLDAFLSELAALRQQGEAAVAEVDAVEGKMAGAERRIEELNEELRASEGRSASDRERIAAHESTVEHHLALGADLEREIARHRQQLASMAARVDGLQQQLREADAAIRQAEDEHRLIAGRLGEGERSLTELLAQHDQARGQMQQYRALHAEQMRVAAVLGSQVGALESEATAALAVRQRCEMRRAEIEEALAATEVERRQLLNRGDELARKADQYAQRVAVLAQRLVESRQHREHRLADLAQLQQRRTAVAERVAVLEELESRYEGLSPGVRDVIAAARSDSAGLFRQVRGLVADLLRVSVEAAELIETALGESAQHVVVVPGGPLVEHLQQQPYQFSGRVAFVWAPVAGQPVAEASVELEGRPGVLGRGDRFVETDPEFEPLARKLLGRTWIVEKLRDAFALALGGAAGCAFVTLAGELLAADGTLAVGPRNSSIGLISRRSELRALRLQRDELDVRIQQAQDGILGVDRRIADEDFRLQAASQERQQAADEASSFAHKVTAAEERRLQWFRQQESLDVEYRATGQRHGAAAARLDEARALLRQAESAVAELDSQMTEHARSLERLEAQRQALARNAMEIKVELAKSEERLDSLLARRCQFEESRQERHRAIDESRLGLDDCLRRADAGRRTILRLESEIAELYLSKETCAAAAAALQASREAAQLERAQWTSEVLRLRQRVRRVEEKIHAKELAANEVRHERNALADRLREDYGIELAESEHEPSVEEQRQREEVQQEIDDLRQKINALGNVNLEALEELDQLDNRHRNLSDQFKDLSEAKASLERIIEKINADSRRLFSDTLQSVREHFEQLFRDLFGGGHADIVLEEGVDILEGGIEIVARPPGKEPRSISLLSGGEKTLTCVALLLAMFRSRPSPFCVLDEVDAALDEANIDRFTQVLQGFLAWTQFIIVTHSKRTMTCASTIYGVTMQESGISKQVSVRFEDVSDNGEIQIEAGRGDAPPEDAGADAGQDGDESQAA